MSDDFSNVWLLVPARGGSKGIPRKNLRLLGNKPLIHHLLDEVSKSIPRERVIVSTDDAEIARAVERYATIHPRSADAASDRATLDEVAVETARWLLERGADAADLLVTVQPTSPFISLSSIRQGVQRLRSGARSVISVKDDRKLRWTQDADGTAKPLFEERVNRQWLPATWSETGGVIGVRIGDLVESGTRIQEPVALIELDARQGLDIDTYADWMLADYYVGRRRMVIRADASPLLGMGHVYRAVALAGEMGEHDLTIVTRADEEYGLGSQFLAQHSHPLVTVSSEDEFLDYLDTVEPHCVVLDLLDTEREYVSALKERGLCVVCLEDLGPGAALADIVINDLYTDFYPQNNHWYGVDYAILAPSFEAVQPRAEASPAVENVLATFGGTDPQNLTIKTLSALRAIAFPGEVTVVVGPGYPHGEISLQDYGLKGRVLRSVKNMAELMYGSDLAITSGGRTVTELMTLGVPTIVMCQNLRELRHTHASSAYGVINLGLGKFVDDSSLGQHIEMVIQDPHLRADMRSRALRAVSTRSNRKIAQAILNAIQTGSSRYTRPVRFSQIETPANVT